MTAINVSGYALTCEERAEEIYITECKTNDAFPSDELSIPENVDGKPVAGIERKAFLNEQGLRKVIIPGTVKSIGDWAFSQCRQLKTFVLGKGAGVDAFTGRGIFEGSERLEDICIGYAEPDDLSLLAALPVKRLPAAYLLRDPSFGSEEWYQKLDMAILDYLRQDDIEGYSDRALCGEEDISYDGVGSVDGELPGESAAYLKEVGKNKAGLAFTRLTHSVNITEDTKTFLLGYMKDRSKGCGSETAWFYISEDRYDDAKAVDDYLDMIRPDKEMLKEMIDSVASSKALLRAKLIAYKPDGDDDLFAGLAL